MDFLSPDASQIDLRDIVVALGRNHRFGGHSPLKVAQHVLEVANGMMSEMIDDQADEVDVAEAALIGMIHDFPEYAVQDMPTPLKRLLGPRYAEIEDRLLHTMLRKWDLKDAWERHNYLLKKWDQICVEQEALRFGLDGKFVEENGTVVDTPHDWVSPQEIIYSTTLMESEAARTMLFVTFIKFMWVSGRKHLLNESQIALFANTAARIDADVETTIRYVNPFLPELLLGRKHL